MVAPIKDNEYLISIDEGLIKVKATGNFVRVPIKRLFMEDVVKDLFEFIKSDGVLYYIEDFLPILPIKNFYN